MNAGSMLWLAIVAAGLLASCGGGGTSSPSPSQTPATPATTTYPNSVVVGAPVAQSLVYTAATAGMQATVTTTVASPLLTIGATLVLAEHVDGSLPGLRVVCVSGHGETTNVVSGIDLGVIAESAAVLLDADWHAVEATAAWTAAVAGGGAWLGWVNCGVKPEGAPSPSSRLVPTAGGGYVEDVYDGNPGTTFQAIRRNVAATDVAAMLAPGGLLALDDPLRPLQLFLRAYADAAGHVVFVESGTPAIGAPPSARGFVSFYQPGV